MASITDSGLPSQRGQHEDVTGAEDAGDVVAAAQQGDAAAEAQGSYLLFHRTAQVAVAGQQQARFGQFVLELGEGIEQRLVILLFVEAGDADQQQFVFCETFTLPPGAAVLPGGGIGSGRCRWE